MFFFWTNCRFQPLNFTHWDLGEGLQNITASSSKTPNFSIMEATKDGFQKKYSLLWRPFLLFHWWCGKKNHERLRLVTKMQKVAAPWMLSGACVPASNQLPGVKVRFCRRRKQLRISREGSRVRIYNMHACTPLKINMEHNHGGLEDHFRFKIGDL